MYITIIAIFIFFIGLYFYAKTSYPKYVEGFNNMKYRCPDLLIQKDSKFYLYNSKLAQVPGVNPIEFDNLEDYTEFLDWQRSQGIRCPVLYLQSSYDAQGNQVYNVRPSITEPQAGLPPSAAAPIGIASQTQPTISEKDLSSDQLLNPNPTLLVDATHNDPPYNYGNVPAYDESSYYVGATTPLDKMNEKQQQSTISPNPMDDNWGGQSYTDDLIKKGYYKENEVQIYIP